VVVQETERVSGPGPIFSDFYRQHHPRLSRACLLLTSDPTEAEDLAQEAMARVLERWDKVSGMDDPEGYLFRTALNLQRNAVKRLAMAARRQAKGTRVVDDGATERSLDVRRFVRALPMKQRQALVLVEWLGYTAEEAAPILGIDAASVRGRLHRARTSLRQRIGGLDE
jgi:RNA polymerase sigma-70 factor (ECF subfamily)